jgi:hypothetical protein
MSTPFKNVNATTAVLAAAAAPVATVLAPAVPVKNVIRKEDAILDLQRTTLPRTRSFKHGYTLENIMEDPYIFQSEQERKAFAARTI